MFYQMYHKLVFLFKRGHATSFKSFWMIQVKTLNGNCALLQNQQLWTLRAWLGFPGGSDGKESTCNAGDLDSIPGLGRSLGGGHKPLQYSSLGTPHGQRILEGYSSWSWKESDMTEWLSTAQHRARLQLCTKWSQWLCSWVLIFCTFFPLILRF